MEFSVIEPGKKNTSRVGHVETIEVPVLSEAIRRLDVPLSLVTVAGDLVFVSGIPPLDVGTGDIVKGDVETQTKASLAAVEACLKAANTSFGNVVAVKIYAANAGHYDAINRVYKDQFSYPFPSRTFVPVGSWWTGFDLEIECIAVRPTGDIQKWGK